MHIPWLSPFFLQSPLHRWPLTSHCVCVGVQSPSYTYRPTSEPSISKSPSWTAAPSRPTVAPSAPPSVAPTVRPTRRPSRQVRFSLFTVCALDCMRPQCILSFFFVLRSRRRSQPSRSGPRVRLIPHFHRRTIHFHLTRHVTIFCSRPEHLVLARLHGAPDAPHGAPHAQAHQAAHAGAQRHAAAHGVHAAHVVADGGGQDRDRHCVRAGDRFMLSDKRRVR